MKITIGCDHAGVEYKSKIVEFLEKEKHEVLDVGTFSKESVDYPDYAHLVAEEVLAGADYGVLICGSGNGVSMAANKHEYVRAALCWSEEITKLARQHNDANIISIPARFLSLKESIQLIKTFLTEPFEGGRHLRRVEKI
jgi:ribose 5-phosphate isomerase B